MAQHQTAKRMKPRPEKRSVTMPSNLWDYVDRYALLHAWPTRSAALAYIVRNHLDKTQLPKARR